MSGDPTASSPPTPEVLGDWRGRLVEIVRTLGYEYRDEPFELSSGRLSHDFVDGKRALARGADLELACRYFVARADEADLGYDAVGGLTMGADQFAHGVAIVAPCDWFVVRKAPKGRGTNKVLEGADITGRRVVVCEDAVSTGGSILKAIDAAEAHGAVVAGAFTLIDRGDAFQQTMHDRGIWYLPIMTYRDLGIEPIA